MKINTDQEKLTSKLSPKGFCVFCGEKPEEKTKEHIIPQWLIKLTGDPNRKINLGIDLSSKLKKNEYKIREFSFSSFKFPACNSCNSEFSHLENTTKFIVEKILNRDFLNITEINTLLNWFDKIRTGLWLCAIQLDRDFWQLDPNFHIKRRIAEKDRCLLVYEFNDDWKGIQFSGFNAPAFLFCPSCISLVINNFYFLSISNDFLFSRNIGFPYPSKQFYRQEDKAIEVTLTDGLQKIKSPLIKGSFLIPSIEIYQPIIPTKMIATLHGSENLWNNKYVETNCLDYSLGLGNIFFKEGKDIASMGTDEEVCFSNENLYDRQKVLSRLTKQVLNQQLQFIQKLPSTENLNSEEKKSIKHMQQDVVNMQKSLIKISNMI